MTVLDTAQRHQLLVAELANIGVAGRRVNAGEVSAGILRSAVSSGVGPGHALPHADERLLGVHGAVQRVDAGDLLLVVLPRLADLIGTRISRPYIHVCQTDTVLMVVALAYQFEGGKRLSMAKRPVRHRVLAQIAVAPCRLVVPAADPVAVADSDLR